MSHWRVLALGTQEPEAPKVLGELDGGIHILRRWKSSLWKLVWKQLIGYFLVYFLISLLYRTVLQVKEYEENKKDFEKVYFETYLYLAFDRLFIGWGNQSDPLYH